MTTVEEKQWEEAAAAYDSGRGISLEEINPDNEEDMKNVYAALNVNSFAARTRMKRFIRRLWQQQQQQQQQQQDCDRLEEQARKRRRLKLREAAHRRGEAFINSCMQPVQEVEEDKLFCLRNVVMLTGEGTLDIILTPEIQEFWQQCVHQVTVKRKRVCARGSPGVGKTLTMLYLIGDLVNKGKRVVYLQRTSGYYYEWKKENETVRTEVHPESTDIRYIIDQEAEDFKDTFYLCDPGESQDSCNPVATFPVKFILNASADEQHWGGEEFEKEKAERGKGGVVLTFPMMKEKDIFLAHKRGLVHPSITEQMLEERHREFGNILRFLFSTDEDNLQGRRNKQDDHIKLLTSEMASKIMDNQAKLNASDPNSPRSSILCVTSKPPKFMDAFGSFVSDLVAEKVAKAHMRNLWSEISAEDNSSNRGHLFERYVRSLFLDPEAKFDARKCVAKPTKKNKEYNKIFKASLGGCKKINRMKDMVEECRAGDDGIIFYSRHEHEPLVDFMYKKGKKFFAIQTTISSSHSCREENLEKFYDRLRLQSGETLKLVYAVPDGVFGKFVTKPVTPICRTGVSIIHACIPAPQRIGRNAAHRAG